MSSPFGTSLLNFYSAFVVLVDTYWHFGTHWYSEDLEKDYNCDDHEVKAAIKGLIWTC